MKALISLLALAIVGCNPPAPQTITISRYDDCVKAVDAEHTNPESSQFTSNYKTYRDEFIATCVQGGQFNCPKMSEIPACPCPEAPACNCECHAP